MKVIYSFPHFPHASFKNIIMIKVVEHQKFNMCQTIRKICNFDKQNDEVTSRVVRTSTAYLRS